MLLQPYHALHIVQAHGLGQEHPLLEAQLFVERKCKNGGNGHKTQATNLNQGQNHNLSKSAPLDKGIYQNETSHTRGRSGSKERSEKTAGLPTAGSHRKRQQKRTRQNDASKTQGNDPGCGKPVGARRQSELQETANI